MDSVAGLEQWKPAIRGVVFDLGDTLIEYEGVPLNWAAHYNDALYSLAEELHVKPTPEALATAAAVLRGYNTRLHPRTHLAQLRACLGAPDATNDHAAATAFFRIFRRHLRCFPDTVPCIAKLRERNIRVGVFTDVPYGMPPELVHEDLRTAGLGAAFDFIGTSVEVGFRKPAAETLRVMAKQLGCEPANLVHVGNEQKDIEVAGAYGCRSVLIHRAGSAPTWGQDRTVQSLAEFV